MTEQADVGIRPDTEAAEDFAEEVGIDPTQDEIEHYRRLEGEPLDEVPATDLPVADSLDRPDETAH